MGKGKIISGGTGGFYTLELLRDTDKLRATISHLQSLISHIDSELPTLTDTYNSALNTERLATHNLNLAIANHESTVGLLQILREAQTQTVKARTRLEIAKFRKASCETRVNTLLGYLTTSTISAWCTDYSESLIGIVGTIDIPGDRLLVLIRPGYTDNAAYIPLRDGHFRPTPDLTPAQGFYNYALLPGWQRWKPQYRSGTITAISGDKSTCTIQLHRTLSRVRSLPINPDPSTLSSVPFQYMDCDGVIFEVGDSVIIEFPDRTWDSPRVIGFLHDPRPCFLGFKLKIIRGDLTLIDESLLTYIKIYDSTKTEVIPLTPTYDPVSQYWSIEFPPGHSIDPSGYWVVTSATDSLVCNYPHKYRTVDRWNPTDLISPGTYTANIPYWNTQAYTDATGSPLRFQLGANETKYRGIIVKSSIPYRIYWNTSDSYPIFSHYLAQDWHWHGDPPCCHEEEGTHLYQDVTMGKSSLVTINGLPQPGTGWYEEYNYYLTGDISGRDHQIPIVNQTDTEASVSCVLNPPTCTLGGIRTLPLSLTYVDARNTSILVHWQW